MPFDLVIRNGWVADGLGSELVRADVGVRGDTLAAIGPKLDTAAARVLDATDAVVAPGFIDIHAHGDLMPLLCPEAPARLHDGVTLEIVGNCGESPFPQNDAMLAERRGSKERHGAAADWKTLDDYARRHDAIGSGIHRGSLVGHGNVRQAVMGEGDRAPTADELAAMRREVAQALDAGAFGLSTGLFYAPGMFAPPEEVWALAKEAARRGALYASHIRSEGEAIEAAIEEFAEVGRRTGVRLQHSHIKTSGEANWPKADAVIARLSALRAEGLDLACDRYPYTAGSTSLTALLPGWSREGGRDRLLARLADPADRARIAAELEAERADGSGWHTMVVAVPRCATPSPLGVGQGGGAPLALHAPTPTLPRWGREDIAGRSIRDLATAEGCPPAEMVLRLVAASEGRASILMFSMCEANLVKFLALPFVMVGSDSYSRGADGPTAEGKPHPRSYGTSARFLGRYVREQGLLPLPEALRRLTGLPASRLGLARRGVLRVGACADVTVFDPATIADRATYEHPQQYSVGVRHVLVNGAVALEDGELTGTRAGRFLRRGRE